MAKLERAVLSIALMAFLALSSAFAVWSPVQAHTPRAPILILGDAGFTESNGVVGGVGTRDNPYVIEGWEIDASTAHGIEVRETNASFVIRGVRVRSGGTNFDGIVLRSVSDGSVVDCEIQYNANGIRLVDVRGVSVSGVNATLNYFDGISAAFSSNLSIGGNRVEHNGDGIYLDSARDIHVVGNTVVLNRQDGVFAYNSQTLSVEGNVIARNGWTGLHVSTTTGVWASANSVTDNSRAGMSLESSTQLRVHGNTLVSNLGNGIFVVGVRDLDLSANVVSSSAQTGVSIEVSRDLNVSGNMVSGSRYGGLIFLGAERASVSGNWVVNNSNGVSFLFSRDIRLDASNVSHNQDHGAYLADVENATVAANRFAANAIGMGMEGSGNVTTRGNEIRDSLYGLYLFQCSGARTHHNNFVSNGVPGTDDGGSQNAWDDGYPSGGNYWSDYAGVDRCSETNQTECSRGDGIGDRPYEIDADTSDRYPLVRPYGTTNQAPIAAFTVAPSAGDVSTVFTVDASQSVDAEDSSATIRVRWDWEGDGAWDTAWLLKKTTEHRYESPGEYAVRLEVQDSEGLRSFATVPVSVRPVAPSPFVTELAITLAVGVMAVVVVFWVYPWWRRGWYRRARIRQGGESPRRK